MTTKRKKRHSPEQIAAEILEAERILAKGADVVAIFRQPNVTGPLTPRGATRSAARKLRTLKS